MPKQYDYDYEHDLNYCYPESSVLINKLNIRDRNALLVAEREITALRIAKAKDVPIIGNFDFCHLKAINKYIFGDIYFWAGDVRSVNISKGNQFCLSKHVETYASDLFNRLKAENYLTKTPQTDLPERLSYYFSEINVLHPFREGNGRTQRLFIEYLADNAGYIVDFSNVSDKEMIIASAEAFACVQDKLNEIFKRITTKK